VGDARPIGFFDSGVGGLTVLREVVRRLPFESTLYLGDGARAPYGPRSDEEVIRFSSECLDELADRDVKAIVIACNTSSAVALPELRRRYGVPILGVVRPGAAAAALATRSRRVGVIATQATIRSHAYFQAIKDEDPFIEVRELATPELVPLVESGELDGAHARDVVTRSLAPLFAGRAAGPETGRDGADGASSSATHGRIDTLVLGCTHYPLLAPHIGAVAGADVAIIDSASATASALAGLLDAHDLAAEADAPPSHLQLTTGDLASFRRIAQRLFGDLFPAVEAVAVADPV
jgi:glutamate racemase